MTRTIAIGAAGAWLALIATVCAADVVERSFDVGASGTLEIDTDVGSINVSAHDAARVDIEVERRSKASEGLVLEFEQEGSMLRVTGEHDDRHGRLTVSFVVRVPRAFDLDLRTSGGSIRVEDLDGQIRARTAGGSLSFGSTGGDVWGRTAGGSIRLEGTTGEVDLQTAGGSVHLGDVDGRVKVRTAGGSIRIGDASGEVEARTAGGSIRIGRVAGSVEAHTSGGSIEVDEAGGSVNAETSGGNVTAYIAEQPTGNSQLRTSGGRVTVYLAEGISVSVDARGGDREVESDFEFAAGWSDERTRLRADLNGGGPRLSLRATEGIRIQRQ